jgi:hypothetical protein
MVEYFDTAAMALLRIQELENLPAMVRGVGFETRPGLPS